jgi:hypothetical protein
MLAGTYTTALVCGGYTPTPQGSGEKVQARKQNNTFRHFASELLLKPKMRA